MNKNQESNNEMENNSAKGKGENHGKKQKCGNSESYLVRTPRRNTVLRQQARRIIYNVVKYMQKEKDEGVHNVAQVQRRAADATGTSVRTIRNILNEAKKTDMISGFRTPGKKRQKPSPITGIDNFDKGVIKRCIYNFHVTEKAMPSISQLLAKLQRDINFKGSASSLSRIIKELGFKWRKTVNNRRVLIEKSNMRLKRIQYLKQIKKYRDEGKPIVYTDETYVYSSHTKGVAWADETDKGLKAPISKVQRVIFFNAGSEDGFVPNGLLMFEAGSESGDCHDDMDFYEKWLRTRLIPNLSPNSVVVIGNAHYHNKIKDPAPMSNSRKEDMELWLTEKGVAYENNMLKPELYQLIRLNKGTHKNFVIDHILAEHNHIVLRLPPCHSDLNPMEMAWAAIKDHLAARNVNFNVTRVMELVEEKVGIMSQGEWMALCKYVKKIEDQYRASDLGLDTMTDGLIIYTEDSSESEMESDNEITEMTDSDSDQMVDLPSLSPSEGPAATGNFMEGAISIDSDSN